MGDFSCYITIQNTTSLPMEWVSQTVVNGNWVTNPPPQIPANSIGSFQLKDNLGFTGTEGFVNYKIVTKAGDVNISSHFACPVWSGNILTATSSMPKFFNAVAEITSGSGHPLMGLIKVSTGSLVHLPKSVMSSVSALMKASAPEGGETSAAAPQLVTDVHEDVLVGLAHSLTQLKHDGLIPQNHISTVISV